MEVLFVKIKSGFLMVGLILLSVFTLIIVLVAQQQRTQKVMQKSTSERDAVWNIKPAETPQAVVITSSNAQKISSLSSSTQQSENSHSLSNLSWTFGGKQQRGWRLYVPLVSELIGTNADVSSVEFAAKLAVWQGSVNLQTTGVINTETFMIMVKTWQEQRSTDRTYPTTQNLVTAPADEFFDSSRAAEMRQVERETYAAYKRLLRAAINEPELAIKTTPAGGLASTEQRLRIISAFRSREYQERLRRLSPNSGRAGLAVNSPHFTGRALDIYIAGEPVETKDSNRALQVNTPLYRWLVKNAGRFGFRPYFYEPWHWEYDPTLDMQRNSAR
jgi:LAS superfamily LD-carboxypeptidase LdcB